MTPSPSKKCVASALKPDEGLRHFYHQMVEKKRLLGESGREQSLGQVELSFRNTKSEQRTGKTGVTKYCVSMFRYTGSSGLFFAYSALHTVLKCFAHHCDSLRLLLLHCTIIALHCTAMHWVLPRSSNSKSILITWMH